MYTRKQVPPPSLLCVSNRLESFPVQPYSETHTHPVMLHGKKKHKSQRTFRAVCVCDYIEPKEKQKNTHTFLIFFAATNGGMIWPEDLVWAWSELVRLPEIYITMSHVHQVFRLLNGGRQQINAK